MTDVCKAVTHNGKFHADEVFATATLRKLYPKLEVTRSRDPEVIADGTFVYDVGGVYDHEQRRYDHHQLGAHTRENGLTYSAFGLIWLHYGLAYCDGDEAVRNRVDDVLVRGIDAGDNGESEARADERAPEYGISQVIEQLNPIIGSDEEPDVQFAKAVGRASEILSRIVLKARSEIASEHEVRRALETSDDTRYAILDHPVDLSDCISRIEGLEYLIFPQPVDNTWQAYAIPILGQPFSQKHPFPKPWAGLTGDNLAAVTHVADAVFCHKKRFLAVAKSREGALALLAQALQ